MEVNPGYKQTEVGVIPEDWDVSPIGELCSCFSGGTPSTSNPRYYGGDIPWITSGDLNSVRIKEVEGRITGEGLANSAAKMINEGTLMLALYGATAGVSAVSEIRAAINQAILAILPKRLGTEFLFQYLRLRKDSYISTFTQGGQPNFSGEIVKSFIIPIPPTKAEQQAIAEALSDADALIESLEQLLIKKRHLKQGAMQDLIREKPRDKVRLLREVSSLKGRIGWQGLKQTEFTGDEDEPFLITGMNFKDGAIRWGEVYHIPEARYEMAPDIQLQPEDVLMTKDGTIGKVLYIDSIPFPGKASLNSHLLLFRPFRGSYNSKYLYYQLGSQRFKDFIELSKSGTTFFGLSQAAVGTYPVLLPPMEEQARIAGTLSDMEAEIAALEEKLTKARQVKQGMMQELLTGRIRLV